MDDNMTPGAEEPKEEETAAPVEGAPASTEAPAEGGDNAGM